MLPDTESATESLKKDKIDELFGGFLRREDSTSYNIGKSDYSKFKIQPWHIWEEYKLNPWDADIIKRVLRTKEGDPRKLDYEKIIHICQFRIDQLERGLS